MRTRTFLSLILTVCLLAVLGAQEYYPGGGGGGAASAPLTGSGATVAANTPLINVTQTWNNAGVTFQAMRANITSTASAAASVFWDLQLASVSQFQITKTGAVYSGSVSNANGQYSFGPQGTTTTDMTSPAAGTLRLISSFNGGVNQGGTLLLGTADSSGLQLINPGSSQRFWVRTGTGAGVRQDIWRLRVQDPGGQAGGGIMIDGNNPAIYNAIPQFGSGFGTSPAVVSGSGGTLSFRWNVGTGGTATSGVINLGTADNNWNCFVNNLTAAAAHRADNTVMTSSTTTAVTVENQTKSTGAAVAWTASDILSFICAAY